MVSVSAPVSVKSGTKQMLEVPRGVFNKSTTLLEIVNHIQCNGITIAGDMIIKVHQN